MTRLTWLADVLRAEGLQVQETAGWKTRGRDGGNYSMRPKIVIIHHTATHINTSDGVVTNLLINGRSDLPGPLCHLGLNRQGVFIVVAGGKANHAGAGIWKDANESVEAIGIEAYNYGNSVPFPTREPWPPVQLEAYGKGVAALLRKISRDEQYVCAHREWSLPAGRKPDPSGINMDSFRTKVGQLLREDEMSITDARLQVAAAWFAASGEWMTPTPTENRQIRLTRLAGEVLAKSRTAAEIANHAIRVGPSDPSVLVPAWVLTADVPFA